MVPLLLAAVLACTPTPQPAAPEEPARITDAGGMAYTLVDHSSHGTAAAVGTPRLSGRLQEGVLRVSMANVSHYCSPAPRFNVQAAGPRVTFSIVPPEGGVSRCVGPHSLTVEVDGVDNAAEIVLVNLDGEQAHATL